MSSRGEQLRQQLQKKHDAEERALQVVVALLETGISRTKLVDAARYINVDYYSDVTTERAISLTCGYPLCDNPLTNVPRQKYRISLQQKKVYDLSELKNFCSDRCFRASKYFEAQLSTSPVWAFDDEQAMELAHDRPLRPLLIDDALLAAACTEQIGDGEVAVSPTWHEVDSAAVVVNMHDVAARVDDLQLRESAADIVAEEDRDDDLSTIVGCDDQLGPVPALYSSHEPEPQPGSVPAGSAAVNTKDSVGPWSQSRQGLLSLSSRSRMLPEVSPAHVLPVQTALSRLMEWRTAATTAWLLGDAARSCPGAAGVAAHSEESQQAASMLPVKWPRDREEPTPAQQRGDVHPRSDPTTLLASDDYSRRAVRFLVAGDSVTAATVAAKEPPSNRTADDTTADDRTAGDWRTVPPSDEHGQDFIRRRLVTERLSKSLGHAETVLGSDIIANIRSRNLSRLASSFKLTKDNVSMKPTEWLLVILLLAYVITQGDEVANLKVRSALCGYGCTLDNFNCVKEQFCFDFPQRKSDTL